MQASELVVVILAACAAVMVANSDEHLNAAVIAASDALQISSVPILNKLQEMGGHGSMASTIGLVAPLVAHHMIVSVVRLGNEGQ